MKCLRIKFLDVDIFSICGRVSEAYGFQVSNGGLLKLTAALITVKSICPFAAPVKVTNFSQISWSKPSRLLSARVLRKFRTVSPLSDVPACLWSSSTIWDLSCRVNVGALRIMLSFGSFLRISRSEAKDLLVLSKVDDLTAAVY